ncbi:MAG: hypothetical protein RIS43_653 [Actinomycetota bacterium]|jgi:hypothetical protein
MTQEQQVAYVAIGIAAVALFVALISLLQVRKSRKALVAFRGTENENDLLAATAALGLKQEELTIRLKQLSQALAVTQRDVAASLRHMAVVRFNAISETGPQYSFSAAILDDHGNGLVLTCLQGRDSTRVYSKTLLNGKSELALTPEELQAIESAKPVEQ